MAKALGDRFGAVAARIEDAGDNQGQQQLHDRNAKAAESAHKPTSRTPGIGGRFGGELVDAARLDLPPYQNDLVAEEWDVSEP